jgi:hypothetical protein
MEPRQHLRQETRAELGADHAQSTAQTQATLEFTAPEELLRHDRKQTPVPASVAARLEISLQGETPPAGQPWWKRIFK